MIQNKVYCFGFLVRVTAHISTTITVKLDVEAVTEIWAEVEFSSGSVKGPDSQRQKWGSDRDGLFFQFLKKIQGTTTAHKKLK